MRIIKAAANGSCLFISLRIGLEVLKLLSLNLTHATEPINCILDGENPKVLQSAEDLRNKIIIKWFENGIDKEIPGFGFFDESAKRPWTRGDLLTMEAANIKELSGRSGDIPESAEDCRALQKKYLKYLASDNKFRKNWGGTAEYTAFALIAKITVEVWVATDLTVVEDSTNPRTRPSEYKKHSQIVPENTTGTIKLLFNGQNHYDLLLENNEAEYLLSFTRKAKIVD